MKRLLYAILAVVAVISCDKPIERDAVIPSAKVINNPEVSWLGDPGFVVEVQATVTISAGMPANASWLSYLGSEMTARSTGTQLLMFKAEENPVKSGRTATIDIVDDASGTVLLSFEITQAAAEDPKATVSSGTTLSYKAGKSSVPVLANVPFKASTNAKWLSITGTEESAVNVSFTENSELAERTAEVTFHYTKDDSRIGSVTLTQRGRPADGISLERVWGHYANTDAEWYSSIGITAGDNEDRLIAMDDNYVYVSIIKNNNPDDKWGISVLKREDGSFVKTLRENAGIAKSGLWAAAAMQAIPSEDGGSVLIASNMVRNADGGVLNIYAWTDIDSAPRKISWKFPSSLTNSRFGDKLHVEGTWEEGEIFFVDYISGSNYRNIVSFVIEDGDIDPIPNIAKSASNLSGGSNMMALYPLGNNEYMTYGTSADQNFFCGILSRESDVKFSGLSKSFSGKNFDSIMNGVQLLEMEGQYFLLYVTHDRSTTHRTSYVKTIPLGEKGFSAGLKALTNVEDAKVYPLADASSLTVLAMDGRNGNHTGDSALWKVGDTWYLAALGTGSGISLFKINAE